MSYENFIITVFVIVSDLLKAMGHRHKTNKPKFSDEELITLLIFSMTFRHGDYTSTLKEFKENYNHLFPYIPNLPAITKRAKKLLPLVKVLNVMIRNLFQDKEVSIYIADTKPIPVCKNQRMKRCKKIQGKTYKGNNGTREWFGFKLCLIVDTDERPVALTIMPASKHDINFLKDIKEDKTVIQLLNGKVIVADKAFNSNSLKEEFKELNIQLEAIKKGKIEQTEKERQQTLKRIRKKIETAFSRLYWMGIENIKAVSLDGFITKVFFFVLALQIKVCFKGLGFKF